MTRPYATAASRVLDETAWAALVFGANDLANDPIEDEPEMVTCPTCDGSGFTSSFGGHGYARIPHECHACEGTGEVHPADA
jgi:hypothetical protein